MVAVPTLLPRAVPPDVMEPIDGAVLVHTPPVVVVDNAVVAPTQTVVVPAIADGVAGGSVTVIVVVAALLPQLLLTVYEINDVPADKPVTKPVLFIVATDAVTLLQVPPPVTLDSADDAPLQILIVPVMGSTEGTVVTETAYNTDVAPQVPVAVYEIFTVPVALPLTMPVLVTDAVAGLADDQVPPVVVDASVIVAPKQTVEGPVIASGAAGGPVTVMPAVAAVEPQKLVTV